jgi:predicted Holliday junction resolvase-like endonuclease
LPGTITLLLLLLLTSGCAVRTAVDIVSLPVKATAKVIDLTTTSQAEADQKRGREARKAEERAAKERKRAERAARDAATPQNN